MARDLNSILFELLNDPHDIALRVDLGRASLLRKQEITLRQRAGAAAATLRRAKDNGLEGAELKALEAEYDRRLGRLEATRAEADVADIRRPRADEKKAQIFGRATGEVEKPPLTAAVLSSVGEVIAHGTANKNGVFHLAAEGSFDEVELQLSDACGEILYSGSEPVSVEAGTILQVDIVLGGRTRKPGPVPGKHKMPDLVGQSEDVAKALLEQVGLVARVRDKEEPGAADIVIAQSPKAGAVVDGTGKIALTVRRSPKRSKRNPEPEKPASTRPKPS